MKIQLLDPASAPWSALDACPDRTVFQTRAWLDFVAESQGARPVVAELREGGEVAGYFTGLIFRRFGLKVLGSSFPGWTTPYMGFNLRPGVSRAAALAAVESHAFGPLGCLHLEIADPQLAPEDGASLGFAVHRYETYETDLTRPEDELFQGMSGACRRCIRKAERSGVRVEQVTGEPGSFAREYYEQLVEVFAKQNLAPTYGLRRVELLIKHVLPSGNLLLVRAIGPEGDCIGTGIYPGFNRRAEFWGNASWRARQILRPNETLHWFAMRYWKARGAAVFDWGGGGTYKVKYGPRPAAIPRFIKSRYRTVGQLRTLARDAVVASQRVRQLVLGKLRDRRGGAATAPEPEQD